MLRIFKDKIAVHEMYDELLCLRALHTTRWNNTDTKDINQYLTVTPDIMNGKIATYHCLCMSDTYAYWFHMPLVSVVSHLKLSLEHIKLLKRHFVLETASKQWPFGTCYRLLSSNEESAISRNLFNFGDEYEAMHDLGHDVTLMETLRCVYDAEGQKGISDIVRKSNTACKTSMMTAYLKNKDIFTGSNTESPKENFKSVMLKTCDVPLKNLDILWKAVSLILRNHSCLYINHRQTEDKSHNLFLFSRKEYKEPAGISVITAQ